MNLNFSTFSYNTNNLVQCNKISSSPSFCGKSPQKLIQKILATEDNKKIHLTFDEVAKIYGYLGYDVLMKRGSHAVIPVNEQINIALPIPHKDKYVSPFDIKRLKHMINGDIEKALQP